MVNHFKAMRLARLAKLFFLLLPCAPCFFYHQWRTAVPSASLSATDVVALQLSALQENDPTTDDGLERTFEFASERNREVTGPLERFKEMIRRGVLGGRAVGMRFMSR